MNEIKKIGATGIGLIVGSREHALAAMSSLVANGAGDLRCIEGSASATMDDVFEEWAEKLEFPCYFGYNWDAFNECLGDLAWLGDRRIAILVFDADRMLNTDEIGFNIFVSIASCTVREWSKITELESGVVRPRPEVLDIVFHCDSESDEFERRVLTGVASRE